MELFFVNVPDKTPAHYCPGMFFRTSLVKKKGVRSLSDQTNFTVSK
jgi:hypothetical protein